MFFIYGKSNCQWCDAAKLLLERKGFKYKYGDIVNDETERRDFIEDFPDARTVPQIVHNGRRVGGYEDLVKYLS